MKFSLIFLLVLALPSIAEAKKHVAVRNGKTVVVHTNPAPVVVHRVFPPYGLGKHVYSSDDRSPASRERQQDSEDRPEGS
jgi:hypothetical protein